MKSIGYTVDIKGQDDDPEAHENGFEGKQYDVQIHNDYPAGIEAWEKFRKTWTKHDQKLGKPLITVSWESA